MRLKAEMTSRERKMLNKAKNNNFTNYSSKHIRNKEELIKWKKTNNSSKGSKSRHIK